MTTDVDYTNLLTTDNYANIFPAINKMVLGLLCQLNPSIVSALNLPEGTIRWSPTNKYDEILGSGGTWSRKLSAGDARTVIGLGNVDNTSDANKPVSTAQATALAGKQSTLVSGTNLKTINGASLLGSGDVAVQQTLVSGTNIKTLNSQSLLGTGNITISSTYIGGRGQVFTSSGTFTVPDGVTAVKVRGCGGGSSGATSAGQSNGGTTSFGSYCSATGGTFLASNVGYGGSATGGDINISGGIGIIGQSEGGGAGGGIGTGILGGRGGQGLNTNATGFGNGGCPDASTRIPGGGGGYFEKYITGLTAGSTITVTIGAGGVVSGKTCSGSDGIVIVEW